LVIYVQFAAF